MEHNATAQHDEHPPTTIRQYVMIGVVLTVITLVELWVSYSPFSDAILIATLLILSAVKFAIVVAMFMHLRFDHPLLRRLFVFGLTLAGALLLSLIALFGYDHPPSPLVRADSGAQQPAAGGGHGAEAPATSTEGQAGGEAGGGEGGELMVQGESVAEFFSANCAVCHGQNREGLVGPALTPDRLTQPDDFYHDTIKNGRPGTPMPPWGGQLSDEEISTLVTFIKTVEP